MAAPMKMHAFCKNILFFSSFYPQRSFLPKLNHVRYLRGRAVRVISPTEEQKMRKQRRKSDDFEETGDFYEMQNVTKSRKAYKTTKMSHFKPQISGGPSQSSNHPHQPGFRGLPADDSETPGENLNFPFTHLDQSDKRFGPVLMLTKSRKYREKEGKILLEGKRLITDALKAGAKMEALYFSRLDSIGTIPLENTAAKIYKMKYKSLKNWSDVQTPSGLMGVFKLPQDGEIQYSRSSILPITLICDNIRDPGNMGTLLRTAACSGCKRVLVSKGSVDIWEPKVLRAGAGAHFRIPIINSIDWGMMPNYLTEDSSVFLADNEPISEEKDHETISDALRTIDNLEEEKEYSDSNEFSQNEDNEKLEVYKDMPLKSQPYFDVNYTNQDSILVVGGETHGLSSGAHKLAYKKYGQKVHIPMLGGSESLNSAVASAVILYEMQRQYLLAWSADKRVESK